MLLQHMSTSYLTSYFYAHFKVMTLLISLLTLTKTKFSYEAWSSLVRYRGGRVDKATT